MIYHHTPLALVAALVAGLFTGSAQAAIFEDDFEADAINSAPYQSPIGNRGDDRGLQINLLTNLKELLCFPHQRSAGSGTSSTHMPITPRITDKCLT